MPARPIASARISFSLVSVPVQLYSASESEARISFNWLHKKCGTRLKQQYLCPTEGEKVEADDMIKGYEFEKGRYVRFTKEEIKALDEKGDGNILIKEFVPIDQVDRVYVDKVYYLGTDKGGERHYQLLAEALRKTKRAGLGQYAARGKQYLVLIRPAEGGLVMEQLHYANEVRQLKDVLIGTADVSDGELKLAVQIIEQAMTDAFKPETYHDTVKDKIKGEIDKKREGQEISTEPEQAPQTQILDLMEALKASVAKKKSEAPAAEEAEAKPARKKAGGRR